MRAIYVASLMSQLAPESMCSTQRESFSFSVMLDGPTMHHLKRVVRLRVGEKIMLLDGLGHMVEASVDKVSDDSLSLAAGQLSIAPPPRPWDLVVGLTQEFDEVVRVAQELGVRCIYPWNSVYTNLKELNKIRSSTSPRSLGESSSYARWVRIAVSALEQSNAPWLVKIDDRFLVKNKEASLAALLAAAPAYSQIVTAHGMAEGPRLNDIAGRPTKISTGQDLLLIIGPEGGIAPEELARLKDLAQNQILTLATPILRTPTAVAACYGHLLALKNQV